MNNSQKKELIIITTIALFSFIGIKTLFHSGLFTGHDIWHQVARLYHYTQALNDGQLFPTWISNLNNGFGYPLFIFSYHLPWLIGYPLIELGASIEFTIKAIFIFSFFLSSFSMYWLGRLLFKNRLAAVVSSLLYSWAPYHFLTLYVSASIGTALAFGILPLTLVGILLMKTGKSKWGIVTLSLTIAGLTLSHFMTVVLITPFLFVCGFVLIHKSPKGKHIYKMTLASIVLGIALVAFYLIPLFAYLPLSSSRKANLHELYERHVVTVKQLIYSPWGFGPITEHAKNGEISFQIGIAQWLAVGFLSLALVFSKNQRKNQPFSLALILLFLLTITLMVESSLPIWKIITRFIIIDYPFRLLIVSVFVGSLAAGQLITYSPRQFQLIISLVLSCLAIYTNRNHINVNQYTNFPLSLYIESEKTTTTLQEYLPNNVNGPAPYKTGYYPIYPADIFTTKNVVHTTRELSFEVMSPVATQSAYFGQLSYPGNNLYIDGKSVNYTTDYISGLITAPVPAGEHMIRISFEPTSKIRLGQIISVLSVVLLVGYTQKIGDHENRRRNASVQRGKNTHKND